MNKNKFTYSDYLVYKSVFKDIKYIEKFLNNKKVVQEVINKLEESIDEYNLEIEKDGSKSVTFTHDKIYKMILSNKNEVVNLINQILEIEDEKHKITEEKIEIYNSNFINQYMENRTSDIIYKIKNQKIFFLIEHQSTIDYSMAFRLVEYCILIMQSAMDKKQAKKKDYRFPLIYPIVLYTGEKKWNQKRYLEECQEQLNGVKPKTFTSYSIVDVNSFTKNQLLEGKGILSKIMLLEKVKTEEELINVIKEISTKELNQEEKNIFKKVLYNILGKSINKEIIEKSIKIIEKEESEENGMVIEEVLRKSREEEYKKGMIHGVSQEREKIIKQMIKNNIKDEIIIKLTKISKNELERIKNKK